MTRVTREFREAIKNAQAQYLRHIGSENDACDSNFCAQAQYLRHIGSESFAFDFNFCAQAQYLRHIGSESDAYNLIKSRIWAPSAPRCPSGPPRMTKGSSRAPQTEPNGPQVGASPEFISTKSRSTARADVMLFYNM